MPGPLEKFLGLFSTAPMEPHPWPGRPDLSPQATEPSRAIETKNPLLTKAGLMSMLRDEGVNFNEQGFVDDRTLPILTAVMRNFPRFGWYQMLSKRDQSTVTSLLQEIMNTANGV
ncbi:MAG TPA: hypothetical protein VFG51_02505 [Candidatus Saccharimonadia bacterium]|nr:hypothetical protein [Candidatus Saccharimonadia bacterium]